MCRFLLIKSEKEFDIKNFLSPFAIKCKENKEWQGDGWGISWLNPRNEWKTFKFLSPIWEDAAKFEKISKSKMFIVHARSSTFEKDKHNIEFNQPFVKDDFAFVFNGEIKGVQGIKVPGKIGSQKIFNLILKYYRLTNKMEKAIEQTKNLIEKNSKEIKALNLGISDKKNFFVLCKFSRDPDYYTLYYLTNNIVIVTSEKIPGFEFLPMKNDEILVL